MAFTENIQNHEATSSKDAPQRPAVESNENQLLRNIQQASSLPLLAEHPDIQADVVMKTAEATRLAAPDAAAKLSDLFLQSLTGDPRSVQIMKELQITHFMPSSGINPNSGRG